MNDWPTPCRSPTWYRRAEREACLENRSDSDRPLAEIKRWDRVNGRRHTRLIEAGWCE